MNDESNLLHVPYNHGMSKHSLVKMRHFNLMIFYVKQRLLVTICVSNDSNPATHPANLAHHDENPKIYLAPSPSSVHTANHGENYHKQSTSSSDPRRGLPKYSRKCPKYWNCNRTKKNRSYKVHSVPGESSSTGHVSGICVRVWTGRAHSECGPLPGLTSTHQDSKPHTHTYTRYGRNFCWIWSIEGEREGEMIVCAFFKHKF